MASCLSCSAFSSSSGRGRDSSLCCGCLEPTSSFLGSCLERWRFACEVITTDNHPRWHRSISEIPVDIDWVTLLGSPACPKRDFDPLRTVLVIRAGRQLSAGSLQREPRGVMPATDGHEQRHTCSGEERKKR